MPLSRRALFGGLVGLAAPAIIRTPGLLMAIKSAKDFSRNQIVPLLHRDYPISDVLTGNRFWWLGPDGVLKVFP